MWSVIHTFVSFNSQCKKKENKEAKSHIYAVFVCVIQLEKQMNNKKSFVSILISNYREA